jgi:hypothetical protein
VVEEEIDYELVTRIIKDRDLGFIYKAISALPSRDEAIRRYSTYKKINPQHVEKWTEPLMQEQH